MMANPAISRRSVLLGANALGIAAAFPLPATAASTRRLTIGTRSLDIGGRAATVYGMTDELGRPGLTVDRAAGFDVQLANTTREPTIIHWHGLTPPFGQDGNTLSQTPIAPGDSMNFAFDLPRGGTNWMHSHVVLQKAQLMAAPLIVREGVTERQDVVMLLHDFSFTPPEEIFATLSDGEATHVGSGIATNATGMMRMPMAAMDHGAMGQAPMQSSSGTGGGMNMEMDLNDIAFDAYLANDRTLNDPEIFWVDRGTPLRLRIINAAAGTNFWIDLGATVGRLVAVDGMDVVPIFGRRFEIAMAQRLDIELVIPDAAVALPILAQREGDTARTGLILATAGAEIARIAPQAQYKAAPVLLNLERRLAAVSPLDEREPDRRVSVDLTGTMAPYAWTIDGRTFGNRAPVEVALGERVEITLTNRTMMSHPMHLHGHHFQVVGLGRARFAGAMRDTVIVPPMDSVTIAFDADNPGEWPLHCHNLYHMQAGMMTTVRYT